MFLFEVKRLIWSALEIEFFELYFLLPVLSGHLAIPRGWPLNTGSTVFPSKASNFTTHKFMFAISVLACENSRFPSLLAVGETSPAARSEGKQLFSQAISVCIFPLFFSWVTRHPCSHAFAIQKHGVHNLPLKFSTVPEADSWQYLVG